MKIEHWVYYRVKETPLHLVSMRYPDIYRYQIALFFSERYIRYYNRYIGDF